MISGIRGEPGRWGCSCVSSLDLAASAVSAKSPSPRVSYSLVVRVGPRLAIHICRSPCAPPSPAPLLWPSVSCPLCRAPIPYMGPVRSGAVPFGASSGHRSLVASRLPPASDASLRSSCGVPSLPSPFPGSRSILPLAGRHLPLCRRGASRAVRALPPFRAATARSRARSLAVPWCSAPRAVRRCRPHYSRLLGGPGPVWWL